MNLYHRKFLSTLSAENVVGLFSRYKGGYKEITESWGMLEAGINYVPDLSNRLIVVIGDGCSPRTGAIFAYHTKAEVISIDPELNQDHWDEHCKKQAGMGFPVQRLTALKCKIEDLRLNCKGKSVLVVWPHSHASMNTLVLENKGISRIDIAMPCCIPIPNQWMRKPHTVYEDVHIESPKRTIHIWID